jgi:ubiquitin-activating enzyme E1
VYVIADGIWDSLDFVLNALDNNIARKYVDSKCVLHLKPLFESGTLGTQANSVICLPGKTPSYSEGAVAGENQGIAKCTLRNFPSLALHCIEWAREMFDDLFIAGPDAFNGFLEDRVAYFAKVAATPMEEKSQLDLTKKWVQLAKTPTFDQCLKIAHDQFTQHFRNGIIHPFISIFNC